MVLGGTVERDDSAAVALAMTNHELAGALRQAHVAGIQVGELADPQAGSVKPIASHGRRPL
jgi:hypothetical protein